jgi:O-antigen/teichoic acid export membrane protein
MSSSRLQEGWLRTVLANSMTRNGLALIVSAALSSILGLGYWILAARLYTAEVLGLNAVLISSMITLANLSQLNLGNFLNRTLAGTGRNAGRIILISYLVASGSAAIFASMFIFALQWVAPELTKALSSLPAAAGFVLCTVVWTIFNLQDSVLSGLRQSVWVPVENGLFSTGKIILLAAFIGTQWAELGPFLAWVLPAFLLIPVVNLLVAGHFVPDMAHIVATQNPKVGEIAGMMGWDYLATIAMMVGVGIAPMLVLQLAGAGAAAGYSIAWAITYSVYLISRSFGIAMVAEAAADPSLRKVLSAQSVTTVAGLLLLTASAIAVLAPYVLLVFGGSYAQDNVVLLRLLVLSTIPWGLVTIYIAMARSVGKTGRIALVQIATVCLFFSAAKMLVPLHGVSGFGFAWFSAHTVVFLAIAIAESLANPSRMKEFMLLSASSVGRLLHVVRRKQRRPRVSLRPGEAQMVALVMDEEAANLTARRLASFDNDCQTLRVAGSRGVCSVYLKRTATEAGRTALDRHVKAVARLRHDLRDLPEVHLLPEILADGEQEGHRFIVQRSMPGTNGRSIFLGHSDEFGLLPQACAAIAAIHASNARDVMISKEWLRQWIDEPLARVASLSRTRSAAKKADTAIRRIHEIQYGYWSGRKISLGWHHGDYSLGNILFDVGPDVGAAAKVCGIIDWDGAADNGPHLLDAWHLALTAEHARRGTEFGHTTAELLSCQGPPFRFRPDRDLPPTKQPPLVMATLAWLTHVHSNLSKSGRYRENLLWRMANVDWVLDGFQRRAI